MKSVFLPSVVVAVAALTSMGTSAELLNQWLFDQMNASSTQTRVEVKADMSQAQQEAKAPPEPGSAGIAKASSADVEKADPASLVKPELVQSKQQ